MPVDDLGADDVARFSHRAKDVFEVALGDAAHEARHVFCDEDLGLCFADQPHVFVKQIVHALHLVRILLRLVPTLLQLARRRERSAGGRAVKQVDLAFARANLPQDVAALHFADVARIQMCTGVVEDVGLLRGFDELGRPCDVEARHAIAQARSPATRERGHRQVLRRRRFDLGHARNRVARLAYIARVVLLLERRHQRGLPDHS